jgi:hypothetical protein
MAVIQPDGNNQNRDLTPLDYNTNGDIKTVDATTALVVGSATRAESYISSKQYSLMWRDSDLLYQSPRPISVFENTYIL